VDVVVPFRGTQSERDALETRLDRLALVAGDTLVIVDNTPGRPEPDRPADRTVRVMCAAQRQTPGFARNRGAAAGTAQWIVFLDADADPDSDLLDRYFDPQPGAEAGLLAGGIRDEPIARDGPAAARYAYIRGAMAQDDTFRFGSMGFPKAANVAVRRAAFEAIGGFREDIRAAEDADLSHRIRNAGWTIERRERAAVTHSSRRRLGAFVVQKALHGSGGAWLARSYQGAFPARRRLGLLWWALRTGSAGIVSGVRARDRDRALWALLEPIEVLAFEFGRSLPNERPLTARVWYRAIRGLRPKPRNERLS
jgi:glycosyltransferase involved in cell wall biosynthesis